MFQRQKCDVLFAAEAQRELDPRTGCQQVSVPGDIVSGH